MEAELEKTDSLRLAQARQAVQLAGATGPGDQVVGSGWPVPSSRQPFTERTARGGAAGVRVWNTRGHQTQAGREVTPRPGWASDAHLPLLIPASVAQLQPSGGEKERIRAQKTIPKQRKGMLTRFRGRSGPSPGVAGGVQTAPPVSRQVARWARLGQEQCVFCSHSIPPRAQPHAPTLASPPYPRGRGWDMREGFPEEAELELGSSRPPALCPPSWLHLNLPRHNLDVADVLGRGAPR